MAITEEDFSFPATYDDSPLRFVDWPPQWRRSATYSRPEKSKGKEVEEGERPSILQEFGSRNCTTLDDQGGEEEKMDLLWEDLNDEQLARKCGKFAENSDISSPKKGVQISCVKALNLSKGNGQIVSGKKTSVLVFIKVLKKVFLIHNSQRAIKKKPSW